MPLKAGSVASIDGSLADSLAEAMENAMKMEWQAVKHVPLPGQGEQDRRLLFAAIAQGLFAFLKANEDALMTNISLEDVSLSSTKTYQVTQLELNL